VSEIYAQILRLADQIRCAQIEREEAHRTVLVPGPASAVKLEAWLAAHGLDDLVTVRTSQFLPADTWIVVDEQAIEAGTAEAIQAMTRQPLCPELGRCPRCDWEIGSGHSPTCIASIHAWGMLTRDPSAVIRVTTT
jgi:hypothetical protein